MNRKHTATIPMKEYETLLLKAETLDAKEAIYAWSHEAGQWDSCELVIKGKENVKKYLDERLLRKIAHLEGRIKNRKWYFFNIE